MTQQEMLETQRMARQWLDKMQENAAKGNLAGAYVNMLLAKDILHQGVRDYTRAKHNQEAA